MPRIRWTEKASRLAEECNETKRSIEDRIDAKESHEIELEKAFGHHVVFTLKDDEIDAEVKLY